MIDRENCGMTKKSKFWKFGIVVSWKTWIVNSKLQRCTCIAKLESWEYNLKDWKAKWGIKRDRTWKRKVEKWDKGIWSIMRCVLGIIIRSVLLKSWD